MLGRIYLPELWVGKLGGFTFPYFVMELWFFFNSNQKATSLGARLLFCDASYLL